jgi:hypothetical protein
MSHNKCSKMITKLKPMLLVFQLYCFIRSILKKLHFVVSNWCLKSHYRHFSQKFSRIFWSNPPHIDFSLILFIGSTGGSCPCDLYECKCIEKTNEECLNDTINSNITNPPTCFVNNCSCPGNSYLSETALPDNCCNILECVEVCPTCPTQTCDPIFQELFLTQDSRTKLAKSFFINYYFIFIKL